MYYQSRFGFNRNPFLLNPPEMSNFVLVLMVTTATKCILVSDVIIYIHRQIQKHPNEEKYYRIFNRRVKFRKHVWTMRNAKSFMTACGWTEVTK